MDNTVQNITIKFIYGYVGRDIYAYMYTQMREFADTELFDVYLKLYLLLYF